MQRRITPRSLGRAQWYSNLLVALGEAEKLLAKLERDRAFPDEALMLRRRIRILSSELELLNQVARGEGRVIGGSWPEVVPVQAAKT